jgi:hypothetical protein
VAKNPIHVNKQSPVEFRELGVTAVQTSFGTIFDERLPKLVGVRGREIYRQMMDNDPVVGSMMLAVEQSMRSVKWKVDPENSTDDAKRDAEFVYQNMNDMSLTWQDFITDALSMLGYGWSYFEILYKRRAGGDEDGPAEIRSRYTDRQIGWRKFAIRSQTTLDHWDLDDKGGLRGMYQRDPNTAALYYIPIQKSLHFKTKPSAGSPEGRSLLRNAFRPWWFKKYIEEIEGIGAERDLAGLPKIIAPKGVDIFSKQNEKLLFALQELVRNVRQDKYAGIILPGEYEFELVGSAGAKQFDTNLIIARYDQRIAMTILAQFILLGTERVGSYALASQQRDLFTTAIEGWLLVLEQVINNYAVARLMRINNRPTRPLITHEPVIQPTLRELTDSLRDLDERGYILPTLETENALRRRMLLPLRSNDDDERDEERPQDVDNAVEELRRDALDAFDRSDNGVRLNDLLPYTKVVRKLVEAFDNEDRGVTLAHTMREKVKHVLQHKNKLSKRQMRSRLMKVLSEV